MRLALVACSLDQRRVVEPLRLRQHRSCHLDEIVECERANRARRSAVYGREPIREQRLRRSLDVLDQTLEYVVEQPDLFIRKINDAVDEKISHSAQGFHTTGDSSVRQCCLQLVEQTFSGGSSFRIHDSILERTCRTQTVSPPPAERK